jgi:hypothetical protein
MLPAVRHNRTGRVATSKNQQSNGLKYQSGNKKARGARPRGERTCGT